MLTTRRGGAAGSGAQLAPLQDPRQPPHAPRSPVTWQNQRAFQKQDCIFVGKKRVLGKAKKGIRDTRYYKSVGLGIKTPRTAIEGTYVDKKCPWTGALRPPLRACMVGRCRRRGSQRRASLQCQRA